MTAARSWWEMMESWRAVALFVRRAMQSIKPKAGAKNGQEGTWSRTFYWRVLRAAPRTPRGRHPGLVGLRRGGIDAPHDQCALQKNTSPKVCMRRSIMGASLEPRLSQGNPGA